jgi:hypothetical protein
LISPELFDPLGAGVVATALAGEVTSGAGELSAAESSSSLQAAMASVIAAAIRTRRLDVDLMTSSPKE